MFRVDTIHATEVYRTWVPCGRRICNWCGERRAEADSRRYAEAFRADGRRVHLAVFTDRAKATNAVRYATRLGHAAVAVPGEDGSVWMFTTHARRDAYDIDDELVELLDLALSQVPAYTQEDGARVQVVPNAVLARALADPEEFRRKETAEILNVEPRERTSLPSVFATEGFDVLLENLDLVTARDTAGRIAVYRIPDREREPLLARMFWCVFEELREVNRSVAV